MLELGLHSYLFFLYIRPQDWVPFFLGFPIDYLLFAFIITVGFVTHQFKIEFTPINVFFILWIIVITFASFSNAEISEGIDWAIEYIKRFIVFLTFLFVAHNINRFKRVVYTMIILSAILGIQNIYQVQHGVGWAGQELGWIDEAARLAGEKGRAKWVGLWDGMNVLCLLMIVNIPFLMQFYNTGKSKFIKLFLLINSILILYGAFLTKSRGGFLTFIIIVFLYFRKKFNSLFGKILIIIVILGIIGAAPSRFKTINDDSDSAANRIDMWYEGFDMVRYKPFFGIGMGNYAEYTGTKIAHNSFIQIMGETGLIGLYVWLTIIYIIFKNLIRARNSLEDKESDLARYLEAAFITLIGYLVSSLFITTEFVLFYMLLGIAASLTRIAGFELEYDFSDAFKVFGLTIFVILFHYFGMLVFWRLF
ncbi:MAG: hypothetical protein Kow00108_00350 [Calditrichia bacterium]